MYGRQPAGMPPGVYSQPAQSILSSANSLSRVVPKSRLWLPKWKIEEVMLMKQKTSRKDWIKF